MSKKLGILTIHGMGNQKSNYAQSMIREIHKRVFGRSKTRIESDIVWESAFWADTIQGKQDELWTELSKNPNMSYTKLRQFVISAFGDAVAYQHVPSKASARDDYYTQFHAKINASLKRLRQALGETDKPLVVIAHSLGSVIVSNYIWDAQKSLAPSEFTQTSFERMETLAGMVTFGSTIPLFSLAYNRPENFRFPPDGLSAYFPERSHDDIVHSTRWLNFFDADDILGYPINPMGDSYGCVEDIEINVGGWLTSWNPLSHTAYWTDDDFAIPVANLIKHILRLL